MDQSDLIDVLIEIEFPITYWAYCDRHATPPAAMVQFGRKEAKAAFGAVGVAPTGGGGRVFEVEAETIAGIAWTAIFQGQRHGLEMSFLGLRDGAYVGGPLAMLAFDAAQRVGPPLARDRWGAAMPYPRPVLGKAEELPEIVAGFVEQVRAIKDALRERG